MSATADLPTRSLNALQTAEAWLDARGKGAWIAAMVFGFVAFWPVGLGLLAYMLYRGKFGGRTTRPARTASRSSGNAAFDAYKSETLGRLEDEQIAFEEFLRRLRESKDKAEFDKFMDDRRRTSEERTSEAA